MMTRIAHYRANPGHVLCVGSQLALAELRIGFTRLVQRLRHLPLAPRRDAVAYHAHFFAYGPASLDIQSTPS